MTRRRAGLRNVAAVSVLVLTACSSTATTTQGSVPQTAPAPSSSPTLETAPDSSPPASSTSPTTLGAQDSTVPTESPTTVAQQNSRVTLSADACTFRPPAKDGEITFVDGGRLYSVGPDGGVAMCLAEVDEPPPVVSRWSPSGAALLLRGDTILDASGTRASGYFADNTKVRWSMPTGKALIAPKASDATLVWRSSKDAAERLDISFLAATELAVYHPAGKHILAVGQAADGTKGLFLAGNRGADARPVATLNDPSTSITDLVASTDGSSVFFVHDHGEFSEIHRLQFPALSLDDVGDDEADIDSLVLDVGNRLAYRVGGCARGSRIRLVEASVAQTAGDIALPAELATKVVTPIGFTGTALVFVAQQNCGAPSTDIWVWAAASGEAVRLVADVAAVSVRRILTDINDLPDEINQQAVG